MVIERYGSRIVKFYVPLALYLAFLLFPFYWMVNTVFKSDKELYNLKLNPFYVHDPSIASIVQLFTETIFLRWMANTFIVAISATLISLAASLLAAYAIQRIRFVTSSYTGLAIFLGYLVPQTILFIPLAQIIFKIRLWDSLWALILTYPTFLIPFCTWLLMGYFKSIPKEMEECAMIDGASRIKVFRRIILPLMPSGRFVRGDLFLYPVLERIHLRSRVHFVHREKDRPHRTGDGAGPGGRLSLGAAHGRSALRVGPRGAGVFVFRRALRGRSDRRIKGVNAIWPMSVWKKSPSISVKSSL